MADRYTYLRDRMERWNLRLEWMWFLILVGFALLIAVLSDKGFLATLLDEAKWILQIG